jgi:hypothetical protein
MRSDRRRGGRWTWLTLEGEAEGSMWETKMEVDDMVMMGW